MARRAGGTTSHDRERDPPVFTAEFREYSFGSFGETLNRFSPCNVVTSTPIHGGWAQCVPDSPARACGSSSRSL